MKKLSETDEMNECMKLLSVYITVCDFVVVTLYICLCFCV